MEPTALEKALDQLDSAGASVRAAVESMQSGEGADAASALAHAASGGAIDPFVFASRSSCWRFSLAITWSGR